MLCSKYLEVQDTKFVPDEEYDKGVREATFYLITTPLRACVLKNIEDPSFHHWILLAAFSNNLYRTMEGTEIGTELTPIYQMERPRMDPNIKAKCCKLMNINTSPFDLYKATVNNKLNGSKYNPTTNNCQHWVRECAKAINENLATLTNNVDAVEELPLLEFTAILKKASFQSSGIFS